MRLAREQTACTWQRTASSNGSDESASVCVNQECYCTKQQTIDLYESARNQPPNGHSLWRNTHVNVDGDLDLLCRIDPE